MLSENQLERQTVEAFIAWRKDRSVALEMRCKDGSDSWGPCVLDDDSWWHHSYYRLAVAVPARPVNVPLVIHGKKPLLKSKEPTKHLVVGGPATGGANIQTLQP